MEQQQKPVDLASTTAILCESCNNNTFKETLWLRKESRFLSGLPTDRVVPIQVLVCTKCDVPVEDFIPTPLKAKKESNNVF